MNLKTLVSTPKGKLIAALSALGFCWLILLLCYSSSLLDLIPGESQIAALTSQVKKLRQENNQLMMKKKKREAELVHYRKLLRDSWFEERDGFLETDLRTKIQEAALAVEFSLGSLGSVKTGKLSNDLGYAEVDLQGSGTIEPLTRFLCKIRSLNPKLYWKRLDLRTDMRPRFGNSASTTTSATVNLNGTLRVTVTGKLPEEERKK